MKTLNFILKSNKEEVINKQLNYFINDNKLNITDDENLYKILLNDKIFMKKNKESFIKIDFKSKKMDIKIYENDLSLTLDIIKSKFNVTSSGLELSYMIDDGENVLNIITINY